MKFDNDMDFVVFYATELKNKIELFSQHKIFLDSQIKASQSLFSSFKDGDFKVNAREYLKKRGII